MHRRAAPWLLLAPCLVLYGALLLTPLVNLFVQSFFGFKPLSGIVYSASLDNYSAFLSDPFYVGVLLRTVKLAAIVVVVSLVVAWPLALRISRSQGRERLYLTLIVLAPLLVSVVVRTFGWVVILGPNGLINQLLQALHRTDDPLRMLFTEGAVVVGLVHVLLPLMILSIVASLDRIDPALPLAARSLGATPWTTLRRIQFPLSLPGVLAGSVIVFALSASAYVTPAVLGGARIKYMSALIYQQNLVVLNWPMGAAQAFILIALTTGVILISTRLIEGGRSHAAFME